MPNTFAAIRIIGKLKETGKWKSSVCPSCNATSDDHFISDIEGKNCPRCGKMVPPKDEYVDMLISKETAEHLVGFLGNMLRKDNVQSDN